MLFNAAIVACLFCFSFVFSQNEDPNPPNQFCFKDLDYGNGRATISRWWYNYISKNCENFIWTGGSNKGNNFMTKKDCEEECKRTGTHARFLSTCHFTANLVPECSFRPSDFGKMVLCLNQPTFPRTREECTRRGCCFQLGLCIQQKSSLIAPPCTIRGSSENGFWGKIDFQAERSYPGEWVGLLRFDEKIEGDLCILRQENVNNFVNITKNVSGNRTSFLLKSRQPLEAGENIAILVAGGKKGVRFSPDKCSSINSP